VLQPAGDLGLRREPMAADRVVGVGIEDLLEVDVSVQLGIQGSIRQKNAISLCPNTRGCGWLRSRSGRLMKR
jgi:hypothetical protein